MTSNQVQPTNLKMVQERIVNEKNVTDEVLNKINVYQAQGNLSLPAGYSAENALKEAWLVIVKIAN